MTEQLTHAELGNSSPGMFAFQRAGSQVLEKTALGSKRLTFQKMSSKETMYNCRLSKVAVLRGGVSLPYDQVYSGTNSKFSRQHQAFSGRNFSGAGSPR